MRTNKSSEQQVENEITIDAAGCCCVAGELAHKLWANGTGQFPRHKVSANNFYVLEPPCAESGFTSQWDIRAAQSTRTGALRYMGADRVLVDVSNAPKGKAVSLMEFI